MADGNSILQVVSHHSARFRNAVIEQVYTGPIQSVSRRLGIEPALRRLDSAVAERLPFEATDCKITVGETTCTFHIGSMHEYMWFLKYPESDGDMPVLTEIVENLRADDNFWDVGSSVGIYSCFASTVIESGTVTSIEPLPNNAERIETNLRLNELDGTVYQLALGSSQSTLDLYPSQSDVVGSFGSTREGVYGGEAIAVEVVPGDAFRARENVPQPTVMKIDAEGAEYDVLQGLKETLSGDGPRLVYCNISSYYNDIDDGEIYAVFDDYGYEVTPIWEWPDSKGHYVQAKKN